MASYKIELRSRSNRAQDRSQRRLGKLELLKWGLVCLVGLSVVIAFLLAAFIVGLLLTVPLVVAGIFWVISMTWRGKIRIGRKF
jgi:Flp pilus assembly protein TadB